MGYPTCLSFYVLSSFVLLLPSSLGFATKCATNHVSCGSRTATQYRSIRAFSSALKLASKSNDDDDDDNSEPLPDIIDEILQVAIEAAKKAGDIIVSNGDGADIVDRKASDRDLLTMVDPLCEKAIRETVEQHFPQHDFLGEEQVPPGKEAAIQALEEKLTDSTSSPFLWIVDPIDGTTNFAHGIPLNLPSIAVAYKGDVVVGVLFDPHREELFTAVRGRGATLNGEAIMVGKQRTLGDAVIAMESPAGQESLEMCVKVVGPLMPLTLTLRMLGSSAVMLPWLANGRLTGYWTPDECAWDIAAGALIVQEAGGKVTDLEGNDYTLRTRSLVATNGPIHEELLEVLQKAINASKPITRIANENFQS